MVALRHTEDRHFGLRLSIRKQSAEWGGALHTGMQPASNGEMDFQPLTRNSVAHLKGEGMVFAHRKLTH